MREATTMSRISSTWSAIERAVLEDVDLDPCRRAMPTSFSTCSRSRDWASSLSASRPLTTLIRGDGP